jgi:hypothetical protein
VSLAFIVIHLARTWIDGPGREREATMTVMPETMQRWMIVLRRNGCTADLKMVADDISN